MAITAPGMRPSAIPASKTVSILFNFSEDSPTHSGVVSGSGAALAADKVRGRAIAAIENQFLMV
jgi:hypothetical protein